MIQNLIKNNLGNVDLEVYRNTNTVNKTYKSKTFNPLITQLDKYLNTENANFSKDEILLSDKILKSENISDVQKSVKNLSGEIYANLPRQIFDIQDRFLKEDRKLMSTLDLYNYNFNFFGNKRSIEDKRELSGYNARNSGFVGIKRGEGNVYGAIGYEYSSIKYNEGSKGSIQTLHTGIYKDLFIDLYDINFGLRADYSFHETNRSLNQFNRIGKVKKNGSYTIGANSEISRTFGSVDFLYIKPMAGFNLTYGKYDGFKENNAGDLGVSVKGEDYLSILPNIGFKIGRNYQDVNLYSTVMYSHEFGNLDKKQNISLLNNKINYTLSPDSLKKDSATISLGMETSLKYVDISFEVGKEFGKIDNNFFTLGLGYKF